ncbi:MAG: hypothetical protein EOP34_05025 [Rickettsiales bacterium]|nr:MAG: hypothetical protein EOP34_05025 [Rickettsiales bacterium]
MMKHFLKLAFVISLVFTDKAFSQQSSIDAIVKSTKVEKNQNFKVSQLMYDVSDLSLLVLLKSDPSNSLISVGQTVNFNTFSKERNRIFLLLSAKKFDLKLKDIMFNVDTTLQKGFCTIKTVVKLADTPES